MERFFSGLLLGIYQIRFRDAKKRRFPIKLQRMVLAGFVSVPVEPQLLDFAEEKVEMQFRKSAGLVRFRFAMHQEGECENCLIRAKRDIRVFSKNVTRTDCFRLFFIVFS